MNKIRNLIKLNLRMFDTVTQTTLLTGLSAEMKTYYEDRLIDTADPKLVHDQFGDKYPIPKNGGKTIEFRKYSPLAKALTPITEGVTPDGNNLNVTTINATVDQYGDWIQLSDMLELTAIDKNILQATKLLGSQSGRSLDTITREVLNGGTNVMFAPSVDGTTVTEVLLRENITGKCKVNVDIFFKAAAQLQAMNANEIDDSFVAIIHPFTAYDIMRNNTEWTDIQKYTHVENIYKGEVGKLGNVRFVSSTEAKIIAPADILTGVNRLTVKTAIESSTTTVAIKEAITAAQAATLVADSNVWIGGVANTVAAVTAGAAGAATITVGTAITSLAAGSMVCGTGAGKDGAAVFSTIVLGANAYATTEIEGGGLQHIVKQLGSGQDPLNQRSSCGWKATKVAKRLVEEYMLRIESGNTYSYKAKSN